MDDPITHRFSPPAFLRTRHNIIDKTALSSMHFIYQAALILLNPLTQGRIFLEPLSGGGRQDVLATTNAVSEKKISINSL